ncbi:OmpA family protein [Flavobacterium sp.]|jgi:outer membrane protein OmpA-like peptidoglycan-associated protein|uniref:OmpA family protein n=1 Tax=Flavobacterium sp. TaxID=239 RepID=UPI0037BE777C
MKQIYLLFLFCCSILYSQEEQKSIVVLFNSNEFALSSEAEGTLSAFFSDETLVISSISIEGFCDDVGSIENNLILSTNRAQSVANFLKSEFNLNCNSVLGKGELPLAKNSSVEENRKNNRKVVVLVTFSKIFDSQKKEINQSKIINDNYKSFSDVLAAGDKVLMKNLVFIGSSTVFENTEQALIELDKVVSYLNNNPNTTIEIQGHVCCIGKAHSDAFDKLSGKTNLSHTRAQKVYDDLIKKGISPNRMTHMGYGRKFPIPGGIESDNKRVEILITKI